jgi:muramoyltetrapeptide carboxypeptidase
MIGNKIKIGIFSTSSPVFGEQGPDTYKFLESKNIGVYEHPQCRKIYNGHLAGSVEERVNAIHEMLLDKSIDILMAFWGGSNTNQILPFLDYDLIKNNYKPIIGYSDTAALLLAIHKMTGKTTFLGPAGISFTKPEPLEYSWRYFKKILIDNNPEVIIEDSPEFADDLYFLRKPPENESRIIRKTDGKKVFRHGKVNGQVVAANLQTLLVLAGTKYFPILDDKILFIEEAEEENTAMIHRYFTHLSQTVNLNRLKAVCIGRMCEQSGFNQEDSVEMILEDVFNKINIPIIYNLDFGHTDPMFTIPIGGQAEINTEIGLIKLHK